MSTKIEWTNETWNPIIGCSKVSEGCKNCYAEKMAFRLSKIKTTDYYERIVSSNMHTEKNVWTGTTHFVESQLEKPFKWKKPRMIFVCSMGDLFHESVPFEWVIRVFNIIEQCPQHTFQILTKRPHKMKEFFDIIYGYEKSDIPIFENVWLGVTAENQEQANKRIPVLLQIPAKVRFVSVEPILSEVDLTSIEKTNSNGIHICSYQVLKPITGCGDSDRPALDWVICGGESGPNARPTHPDWVRSLKDQCERADVPFFFKQWGEWLQVGECGNTKDSKYYNAKNCQILNLSANQGYHGEKAIYVKKVGKKNAGCLLDGKEYKQFPK